MPKARLLVDKIGSCLQLNWGSCGKMVEVLFCVHCANKTDFTLTLPKWCD